MDQSQQRGGSAFNIIYTDVDTGHQSRPELYQKCNRGSHSSDTSSAYSGSDTMTSVHSSSIDADEVDLSGLVESVVDSDEEDLAESMDSLTVRDTVRECLEKDPTDRTEDDIETLLEFTQKLKAFTSLTLAVRRALCSVMVFAVVEKAGTMVMNDGEELDSWSVLINGHVEIEHANGEHEELQVGDSFGILPTMDKLYHQGVMRTKCDDCQFVCITQTDYYRIQHQGEENTKRHEDNGQLVMITELRHGLLDAGTRRGHVVIRGTPERLMLQLIEENSMTDPTYVEDFLLTYRTFIENPNQVAQQLLTWFENEDTSPSTCSATPTEIRDRVTRTVILWVNNHFTDFEFDGQMMEFLEAFEVGLEKKAMEGQLRLLHIACAAKARTRVVTLTRSSRDEPLHFEISGGSERGGLGVFVIGVERRTKAEEVGFKRGDQILEVNGNSLEHVTLARALELLRSTTHLSVTLRSNLLAFREMLATPECLSPQRSRPARRRVVPDLQDPRARLSAADLIAGVDQADAAMRAPASPPAIPNPPPMGPLSAPPAPSAKSSSGFMTLAPKRRLQKALIKMNLLPKNSLLLATEGSIDAESPPPVPNTVAPGSGGDNSSTSSGSSQSVTTTTPSTSGPTIYHSQSNPDLSTYYDDNRAADYPEHVLKVYKADQTCKYLLVHKETTAHEVVMLALQEFGIHETSSNFSLCEVSVGEGGMVKQRRLPDQMQNLAERIGLSARYYLKTNGITETLVPDDVAAELVRENVLNANEVAMQLTFQDFAIFRQIESTEYIDDLFELRSPYGTPMLKQFAELVNREMFWVVTEICSEGNIVRRMKIIKQFVKVARHCKECRNFNSMFAIVSGLGHAAVDLSGLVESVVDSDEEDLAESMDSLTVRDTVRECLEKDPTDRTEDDIETLLEFTQKLKAFTSLTLAVRRALCSVMVFAVVEKAGTMVMNDGEELDSWSVLINGHVEIEHANGEHEELQVGDSFGILPTMDKLYHQGVMRTKCDDCQFVCITQTDYYRIQHQGEENTKRHEDNGQLVMITELRHGLLDAGTRRGHVVIRGTPERLMLQLIEENSMTDPTYVEDFLLTYRTFIENPNQVAQQLLTWFENEDTSPSTCSATPTEIRDRVTRTVILWVNNHFTDFEFDGQMMEFLEAFEVGLEKKAMEGQLRLLHIACAAKARTRVVTLTRSSRDEPLHFEISGGSERGGLGVFVIGVERRTKAEEVGFKRGDQILEVNGNSLEHVTLARALELLRSTTHLSVTLRSNLLAFREMLATPECLSPQRSRPARRRVVPDLQDPRARLSAADLIAGVDQADAAMRAPASPPAIPNPPPMGPLSAPPAPSAKSSSGFMTLAPKRRLQKALIKMNLLPKNSLLLATEGSIDAESPPPVPNTVAPGSGGDNSSTSSGSSQSVTTTTPSTSGPTIYHSQSNPDLSTYYDDNRAADYPEHVLKVYKADQTCKYLLVHKETTAHEVVMLALQEFGIHETSSNFSLCEVSVGEGGMVKQRRLPDQMQNLAERIGLSARYYLKTNGITETLVPDDVAAELVRENVVHFLQLNANEVAMQLTFQQFAELVNREMFWVVTEICSEGNIVRRMKIIKQFVKVARHCKECRNFNSMFAIVSGLGHAAVSRLRATWDKLPSKYQKLFGDLQELMDPSRNMSKYRQLVSTELVTQHPIIPFYPVVKKDLTFIHLGNDSRIEGLINFEKLRMIAKEVRSLAYMCNSPNDLLTMLELRGQPPSSAMVALNQMSVATSGGGTSNFLGGGQATVKRRKKSTAAPNPKKMFEEAQMVRRVKAYLNNMKVTTDEDALHALSAECEPSGGSAPSSVTIRKRHPSPTLSTTSSTSSTSEGKKSAHISTAGAAIGAAVSTAAASGKFGAASPQAVKKILALSEQSKTRPHHPKHPGIVLPGLGHYTSTLQQSSISPSPSPNTHRRINPS
uniref:Putative camp-regulated guanine nucleotide exchange factor n=1 Tax=Lutzomyia longipalpis TaxID=7200 RepID=A0A1B0CL51_LUTLO